MKLKTLEAQYLEKLVERQKQVRSMRASGLSWTQIGLALGVTRQRAQQLGRKTTLKLCKADSNA